MVLLNLFRAPGLSDLASPSLLSSTISMIFLFLLIGLDYYLDGEGFFLGGGGR